MVQNGVGGLRAYEIQFELLGLLLVVQVVLMLKLLLCGDLLNRTVVE